MKKIIYVLLVFIVLSIFVGSTDTKIPEDAIRFRIIANSDKRIDQDLKKTIKKDLQKNLFPLVENATSAEETEKIIKENQSLIDDTLKKYNVPYQISYGENYFPKKEYKGVTYEDGTYKSLVISLGEAKGQNWWCVMYPPLCLLESNSDAMDEVEYKFYFEKIIERLTS